MSFERGTLVGPYEIIAAVGAGGMGEVYRARDTKLGRQVAIKILQKRLAGDREHLRRFEQEARSASALNHPNIITIYEVGEIDSTPYIAMEFIEGRRLRDLLSTGPLPLKKALEIACAVSEGLAAAHSRGIIHRDLKPENVMITNDGFVKIVDFGLAKLIEAVPESNVKTAAREEHTRPGAMMGTPGYMSPEQACGDPADHRSDQFSFGTILYEMLTGVPAFARPTSVETMAAIIRDEPRPLERLNPNVPEQLQYVVVRCLAKDPAERYASTHDLAQDVKNMRDHVSRTGATLRTLPVMPRFDRKKMALAAVMAMVLAGAIAGVVLYRKKFPVAADGQGPAARLPKQKYLAVLPFEFLGGEPGSQLFGDGMAETVSVRLAKVPGIQVMPPSASTAASKTKDMREIARNLGVNLLLRGTIRRQGGQLRVTYTLVDPESGIQLDGDTLNGVADEMFVIEDRLADSVASALELQMNPEPRAVSRSGLTSAAAQDRYFQAIGALQRYEDEASIDQAMSLLTDLLRDAPDSALVQAALGRAALYKFKLTHERRWGDAAIVYCERAVKLDPQLPDVRITLGEVYTRSGRLADAILEFKRALAEVPTSPEATLGLAEAYDRSGNSEEAEKTYRRAIELRPVYWAGYNKLGAYYLLHGRFEEALTMFRHVIRLTPDNVRGHYNLGAAYARLGRFDEAVASFERSIAIRPNSAAYSNLGSCLYLLGRFKEASGAFEKATELTPENYLLWANLGDAYRWTPELESKAKEAYDRAIRLAKDELKMNPRDIAVHSSLALCYAKSGRAAEAETHMREALDLDPNNASTLYQAAILASIHGKSDEALRRLGEAVKGGYGTAEAAREPELRNLASRFEFQRIINSAH